MFSDQVCFGGLEYGLLVANTNIQTSIAGVLDQ